MPTTLTDWHGGVYVPVPLFINGGLTTGVVKPEFIAPVPMRVEIMLGRCGSGSGVNYRPSKNGGTSTGTTSADTGTSVVTTSQNVTLAAGDRLTVNVTDAGSSAADLSVTFWAEIT